MLGHLSAKYESNGAAGAIGRNEGDAGGASYGAGFLAMQHAFVREMYYEPARAALLGLGLDIDGRSAALRQVVWSAAVQYGPGWIGELFAEAAALAGKEASDLDDATLIANIYAVRASDGWTAGSPSLRPSLTPDRKKAHLEATKSYPSVSQLFWPGW